jgi:GMP synthase-like glutamine amidotransferase
MRAHYLQHVPFEGLGSIETWLRSAGWEITCSRLYESPALPREGDFDLLIAMGGPMSVNDEAALPWLVAEKQFVRETIERGTPVLGVCLGAQLIASALGSRVFASGEKEIGWFPVTGVPTARQDIFRFPSSTEVFHWHGETFDLPAGAVQLARSAPCENQAFQLGRSVIGLQFHLETTADSARALVDNCGDELVPARYIQSAETILAVPHERYRAINALMASVLDYLCNR